MDIRGKNIFLLYGELSGIAIQGTHNAEPVLETCWFKSNYIQKIFEIFLAILSQSNRLIRVL
jgi:hypothetical protein